MPENTVDTETLASLQDVVTSIDFSSVTGTILAVLGAAAGFVIGMIAIKKGWAFLKKQIKGA